MRYFIFILLTTLIIPNVTNNGAEVTIPDNVLVTVSGNLTLNSGDFIVDGIIRTLRPISIIVSSVLAWKSLNISNAFG